MDHSQIKKASDPSTPVEILLIGRDPTMRAYTNEFLQSAGFAVRAIAPWEAKCLVIDGDRAYALVVFCHTLYREDVSEIGTQLRRRSPTSKLLLVLGPHFDPATLSIFDATLEGLSGPAALVREVHRLTKSPISDRTANGAAAFLA
jgi:PleD family two-component response regulator